MPLGTCVLVPDLLDTVRAPCCEFEAVSKQKKKQLV